MPLPADHKALLFLGAIAVLGASVRLVRAAGSAPVPHPQPALERQIQASDSSKAAHKAAKKSAADRRRKKGTPSTHDGDSIAAARRPSERLISRDRPLDVDTATAAQLDLLPGVGPALARRIVQERAARGTFINRNELERVPGVGLALVARIDTLITFSGVVRPVSGSDESTFVSRSRRRRPR